LDCEADKNCINCGALQVGEDHAWIAATCDTPATCRKCGATSGEPIDHFAGSDYICVYCGKEIESISGSCGDVGDGSSVTWTLNVKTEVLEISGTGKIKDHTSGGSATWKKHYSKIKAVIVNDGVTGIGDYAFAGCYELTSVLIGNGVTEIGEYAFENLRKLSSVTIGENVNIINDNAFSGCSTLQSLILPDTLTVIGNNAFYSCSALQSLILPDSVTVIGNNAFSDCRGLTELWLGDSVTGIGEAAFADCDQLLSVIIPDSVTIIGESAFYGCDELGIVVIGCGVESIGSCAFMECYNLKNVYLDSTSGWIAGNHAYDTEGFAIPEDEIASPKAVALCLREAEKYSYYYWVRHVHRYTEKVYPPTCFTEGVTEYICVCGDVYYGDRIPPDANAHVYSEMWRIPPECNVEGTVAYTCNECGYEYFETLPPTGIHEYRFSEVVEPTCGQKGYTLYICYRCLEGYADNWTEPTGKHDYTIPVIIEPTCTEKGYTSYTCQYCGAEGARDTWTEPAGHSFNGSLYCEKCGEFSSVAYGFCGAAGNEKAVTWTLDVDKSLLTISGNGEMADYSFESPWYAYSAYVDYVIIENGVENIGKNAFVDQYSLISVEIPDSVTRIEYGAFRNCCSLMNVSLGNGLTEIGGSAFEDCYSLVSITLPESLEAIGYSAFFGCSGLSSVTFAVTSDWHVRETASSQDIVDISETALAVPETAAAYLKGQYLAKYWFRAHIHSYTTVVSAPTCTAAGYTEYTCTSCGYGYIESGAEALGHVMVIDMNNTTFHDCTVGGIFTYACERECGYTEKTTVENGEHIFVSDTGVSEWTVISEATCTAHGYRTRPCLNEYCTADNYSYDPTDPDCIIPMLDHRFDGVCTVEPTYEADGYTYQLCELCGYREIIELIPALSLGTNGLKYEETENGYRIVGYTGTETDIEIPASYKGKPIVGVDPDLFARNALGITSVTISADTSSWDDAAFAECTLERVIVAQNVTYIPRGIFEAAVINVFCYEGAENALTVEDHVLGALEVGEWIFNYKEAHEHEYYAAVTQPDCTAEGAITYVCECGISYVKAAIPALGHSYIASVTYQTCYEEGFAIYTCERCGYEYSEVIEKTPEHVYSNGCDVDCDNCGNIRNAGEHVYDSDSDTECNECGAVREASKIIDSGTCGDAVIWKLTESGVLIISGSGAMDDFSATNVNYMAPWKDYKTTVTKVIIENGVTNIGRQAFNGYTNITEITISEDVTVIGRHCFQNCSNLMSLIIPDSVTKIELSAFSGCTKLSSVIIGKNVSIMEKQVFSNCKALKEIVIPMSVSLIGSMAFSNTGLTSVIFEDASGWWYASSETATSGKTFTSEDLSDPKTATTYLKSRYYSNFWHHTPEHSYVAVITAPTCSEQGYTTYICSDCGNSYVGNYAEPTGKHIYTITVTEPTCVLSGYTKRECSSCGAAYTDNNVNAVGHNYVYTVVESTCVSEGYTLYTCSGCGDFDFTLNTELNKHRYEDVVTAATCIENGYTTYTCADCGNSYIGDVIKAIGHVYDNEYDADCNNCGEVREVEIPVTVIAEGKCGATVNWKLRDDGTLVIYGKGSMNDLETVTDQPWGAYKSQITKVIIEEGIVSIGRSSFYGYNGITEVVLPDSLMAIEEYAFYQCTGLSGEFTIPAKVFYIGGYAFRRAGFTTLTFENPENWTFVNGVALDPTNAAKQFKSGSNFSKICTRTFEESAGNVIGGGELNGLVWTFSDTGVLTVGGEGDIPRFGVSNAPWFAYHGAVKNIVIEGNVTAIGRCAFYAYKVLTAVEINAPVTRIGDYSFYNCSNLKSINVPASVVEIDVYAFRKSGLTTATFEIPYGWSAGDTKIPMAELAGEGAADSLKLAYFAKKMTRDVNAEPEIIDPNYLTHGMLNSRTKWTLYWTDDTQTKLKLVISGKGDMPDFGTGEAPWYVNEEYRNNIVEIVVEDGVTDIGRCAFYGLRYVTKVILNEGLVTIGEFAFNKCRGITEITIPTTVTTIGANAFGGTGLAEIPTV